MQLSCELCFPISTLICHLLLGQRGGGTQGNSGCRCYRVRVQGLQGVSEVVEMNKRGRNRQDISLRVHQNRTVKLFKTMRILLKKQKFRHLSVNEKLLK